MTERLVHSAVADGVATVTLDSPTNRNALSTRLVGDLRATLAGVLDDPAVRVIVLTGAGPVFCAGADLKERREPGTPAAAALMPAVLTQLWESPKPVVCRVNGPARAGGIGLLASCDIVVAPATATFAFTEVRIGVVPAVIAVPVVRRVAQAVALELFLTGDTFDATRAAAIGLVNAAPPAADLDATVERYVGMLVRGAPEALSLTKQVTRLVPTLSLDEGFRQMAELSSARFSSAEGQEGIRSFVEKRDPAWVPAGRRPV